MAPHNLTGEPMSLTPIEKAERDLQRSTDRVAKVRALLDQAEATQARHILAMSEVGGTTRQIGAVAGVSAPTVTKICLKVRAESGAPEPAAVG